MVEFPAKLLKDQKFDLWRWYAQKKQDLKVNNKPELAEDHMNDDDSDNDCDHHDSDDDDDGPSAPGSGTNSLVTYDNRCPVGDPGSPWEQWLSWHYSPEEAEAEWDNNLEADLQPVSSLRGGSSDNKTETVDVDTGSENSSDGNYEYEMMRAKCINWINETVMWWAKVLRSIPFLGLRLCPEI